MNTKNYSIPTLRYKTLVSAIHSLYRLVNSTFELKDMIMRLARLICQIFEGTSCQILIIDPTRKFATLKVMVSGKKKVVVDKNTKITNRLHQRIIKTFNAILTNYFIGVPLVSEDLLGLIIVKRSKHLRPFDRYDLEIMLTMAEQSIIGIKNLQLYEEQQKLVFGSIKSLTTMLDSRIPQEYTHSPYFSKLVVSIAEEMRLDEKQRQSLRYASLLHDAGKIDVPISILTKTTKLTPSEYKIIKRHPLAGAKLLRPFTILRPVIPIIVHHHERYDGSGYPSRLKKGQIPLGARVMAVADAFEAMVYGRPYRERVDVDTAIKEIKSKAGIQFDPKVVEAFERVAKKYYKKYLQHHRR
ncbi:MAG: HD domain-containing protein [Candidatus Omnitrophica bacterium]|nr:HD domain-containing protein [Candidatus Omnitrophota bacterium]